MIKNAVGATLQAIISILPADIVKQGIDKLLDVLEEKIEESENKWDDMVLPLISALRAQLGVTEEEGSPYEDKE